MEDSGGRRFGHFMFLLRSLVMRHSQGQTYRGTTPPMTLMSLPEKTERAVEIEFDTEEKKEYAVLERAALEYYIPFRKSHRSQLGKFYQQLTAQLNPMRIASAGGRLPLDDHGSQSDGKDPNEEDADEPKKNKGKNVTKYTDFAFSAKAKWLIEEFKRSRNEDASSKSLVFSQFGSSLKYLQEELPKHGFQYRTLSGDMSMKQRAKALYDFQQDPPTTIFLLSMR